MNFIKEWAGTVALVAIVLTWLVPSPQLLGASGTRFPNGLSADTTSPVTGEIRGTTLTITSTSAFTGLVSAVTAAFSGLVTLNAGTLYSSTLATSTTDTATPLILADINGYDNILMTPNVGALTLTFPASSTVPTWLPAAGDTQRTCWYNATSTAAATIIFAAGTGIDLEVATSTAQTGAFDLTLGAGNRGCFEFMRQPATATSFDITADFLEYSDAD